MPEDISRTDHAALAEALRTRVLTGPADTAPALRATAAAAGAGRRSDGPVGALAAEVGTAAYRVTDAQVSAVRAAVGSERATFELIAAAAMGAGLHRWDRGLAAIVEAQDAAS